MQLPALEHEVLGRWAARGVARQVADRMRAGTARRPTWTGVCDPPAAAGLPGLHNVSSQVVLDAYRKLRTMQGHGVQVRSSLDCHGLPVEVAVERELGLAGMAGIEGYGAERFAARCSEFALRHGETFSALSTRLGCISDAADARTTMAAGSIDTVWWSLRQIFDAGLLERRQQVTRYCPRCQTALSVHDVRPADAPDRSGRSGRQGLLVRLRLAALPEGAHPLLRDAELVVWLARPWTLVGMAAIAVHPHQSYALARLTGHDDRIIVAEAYAEAELGEDWHVAARFSGAELAGARYYPPRVLAGDAGPPYPRPVISGFAMSRTDGTGLAPVAPAFAAADLAAAARHDLPVIDPIGQDGRFAPGMPTVGGQFFLDAEQALIRALSDEGALLGIRPLEAGVPQCARCRSPVITRALPVWSIRTTAVAGRLRAAVERIRRVSRDEVSSDGTFAGWVGGEDWVVGRSRYWGTPLPLWECSSGHVTCVGGLAELSMLAGQDLSDLDPHRPVIDRVVIACSRCGTPARRVPEVLDARYDAGWMALASAALPAGTVAGRHNSPHADLVIANADRDRGWLGAMLTIGTLVSERPAAGAALMLGPLLDDRGRAMSRSTGNLAEPFPLIERQGADAVRWCLIASVPAGTAWAPSEAALKRGRTMLAAYWDAATCLLSCRPDGHAAPPQFRPLWERWILSELQQLITGAGCALDELRPDVAGARIESFVDALSNWYVRSWIRGRGSGERSATSASAVATLRECVDVLTRIMAPIVPFLTDEVWERIREWEGGQGEPERSGSVHLAAWPEHKPWLVDDHLSRQMALARRLTELGRSARARARLEETRPLRRALVAAAEIDAMPPELRMLLARELNVESVEPNCPGARLPSAGWAVAASRGETVALECPLTASAS